MSTNKIYISPNNINNNISTTEIINEYKNKYNKKYSLLAQNIAKTQIGFNNSLNSKKINKENAKLFAMKNLSKYEKNILIKVKKREINKNKIFPLKENNKNNIYLETDKEILNNPKPDPMPIKINKNNKIDYKEIMQNSFSNKCPKKNNKNNFDNLNKKIIRNEIEENYNKTSIINKNNKLKASIINLKEKNINKDFRLVFILKSLELENLVDCFNFHSIKFSDLFQLSKQDLLEMNIPIGPRNRIINFINEYMKYAKNFDLNELKLFFKSKIKNGIIINDENQKNNNLKISCSENNIKEKNKNNIETSNFQSLNNDNKYHHSYYKNISNISIFNNYYDKNFDKDNIKNKNKLIINKFQKNDIEYENDKINNMFNNYNTMTILLNNKKNSSKNLKIKEKNKNTQDIPEKSKNYISSICKDEEYNKESLLKNNSIKLNKNNTFSNNISNLHNNHKIRDKRMQLINKYSNLNDEVKVFESHLKDIRKRSLETSTKVKTLLGKRRNSTNLKKYKTFFNKKSNIINTNKKTKKENYNTINNEYLSKGKIVKKEDIYDSYNNSNIQKKNIRIFYWENKNFN